MKLSILNYHGLESRPGEYDWLGEEVPYVLSTDRFARQMDEIRQKNFPALNLDGLGDWVQSGRPQKSVIITFDDGLKSQWEHGARILSERKMKALFFVPAMLIGSKGFMTWDDLRALAKEGFEVGSHGLRHVPLTALSEKETREEFELSKKILEEKLQGPVRSFSIPRGFYNSAMREMAKTAGYEFLFTSSYNINEMPVDAFFLKRLVVKKSTSADRFSKMIEGDLGFSKDWEKVKETVRTHTPSWFYDGLAALKRGVRG